MKRGVFKLRGNERQHGHRTDTLPDALGFMLRVADHQDCAPRALKTTLSFSTGATFRSPKWRVSRLASFFNPRKLKYIDVKCSVYDTLSNFEFCKSSL